MKQSFEFQISCMSMPNLSSFSYRILLICLILNFQESSSMPFKSNNIRQSNTKINFRPLRRLTEEIIYGQFENKESNFNEIYEKIKPLQDEETNSNEDFLLIDKSVKNKVYDEFQNEPFQHTFKPKTHKTNIKVDRFKQRVEKKSWKIPMKTLALYTENSHQNVNNHMLDELTEVFNSFKDDRK